ncbi:DUF433 domain-containing protein [uncultured Thiodictyon sp.]|uniref:DUF433 domain-containing protein n=1 Tax=uncultured Thiodictyon sp. TaxID=1846217 RepID=UPI0025DA5C5B|nr:DUF433 domain-containing protein [uncultured Thiodictyon sp.]
MKYHDRIAIQPGKRGGRPVISMTADEIIEDFPELEIADARACLAYAADRERHAVVLNAS